jgi:hypothetical protein
MFKQNYPQIDGSVHESLVYFMVIKAVVMNLPRDWFFFTRNLNANRMDYFSEIEQVSRSFATGQLNFSMNWKQNRSHANSSYCDHSSWRPMQNKSSHITNARRADRHDHKMERPLNFWWLLCSTKFENTASEIMLQFHHEFVKFCGIFLFDSWFI